MPVDELQREEGAGSGVAGFWNYAIGYALALGLSAASFGFVMLRLLPQRLIFPSLIAGAAAQVLVHLFFFLHMLHSSTPRWNIIVFSFAIIVIAILIGGSVWIMASANGQMIPADGTMNMP